MHSDLVGGSTFLHGMHLPLSNVSFSDFSLVQKNVYLILEICEILSFEILNVSNAATWNIFHREYLPPKSLQHFYNVEISVSD